MTSDAEEATRVRGKRPERPFIPVASVDISGREEEYVTDALRSNWISSTGRYIDRFETEFAELCDVRTALSVCNGTAGLHLALATLGIGAGDEVIVPALTYIATANAVTYLHAKPVFVDVDPATWCLDPTKVQQAITSRTRAIIPVHLYGHPADMDAINEIAHMFGLSVIEDAAEAHLATYKGRPVGGLGDIGVFSFYGNKIITCGEGGALTFNEARLATRAKLLRGQGMHPRRRYYFPVTGFNYRLSNLACALLCGQLERLNEIKSRRAAIFAAYEKGLVGIPGVGLGPRAEWADPGMWLFSITIDDAAYGRSRDELMAKLAERNIETRPFFYPLHTLPPFRSYLLPTTDCPVSERVGAAGLNLPTFATLPLETVEEICQAVCELRGR